MHRTSSTDLPLILFIGGLIASWATFNVFRPVRRLGPLVFPSFFMAWIKSELALHFVLLEVIFTGWMIHLGALVGWEGWGGLGLVLASLAGLVVIHRTSFAARGAFDQALSSLPPSQAQTMAASLLVVPFPVRHREVEVTRNLTFFKDERTELKLDLYRARAHPTNAPVLLFVHGGAWIIGQKRHQGLPMMHQLASMGWVCVSIDYRLSPRARFPDHLIDVKRAIKWVREHGAEYGADPGFIIISGNSAGAHLASLAALTPHDPAYQPGFADVDCSVSGCISLYGIYDFVNRAKNWKNPLMGWFLKTLVMPAPLEKAPELWDRASPVRCITSDAPPFLVIHGNRDVLAPVREARRFHETFRSLAREPIYYAEVPGAQHAFDTFPSVRTAALVSATARFAAHLRERHREEQQAKAAAATRDTA